MYWSAFIKGLKKEKITVFRVKDLDKKSRVFLSITSYSFYKDVRKKGIIRLAVRLKVLKKVSPGVWKVNKKELDKHYRKLMRSKMCV